VGIDGTAADGIEPLELARRAQVVALDVEVEGTKRKDEPDEERGSYRDDDKGEPS
jgi:hypothetical protein